MARLMTLLDVAEDASEFRRVCGATIGADVAEDIDSPRAEFDPSAAVSPAIAADLGPEPGADG